MGARRLPVVAGVEGDEPHEPGEGVLHVAAQQVEVGDQLVLLESMKMEIPVLAEESGTLSEVKVKVGDVIQAGDVIAVYAEQ